MKITLLGVGKDKEDYLIEGIGNYIKRIKKYIPFEYKILPALKKTAKLSVQSIKQQEAEKFFANLPENSFLVFLDERGKTFSSMEFSEQISKRMLEGSKNLVFVIGGAYGFDESIINKANEKMSLSKLTFNHQMVRLIFLEQLYRAFSILNNEPYHNE